MNDGIPGNVREFTRWYNERKHAWPGTLQILGSRAEMSMQFINQPERNRSPVTNGKALLDLMDFTTAYTEWKAGNPVIDASTTGH